MKKLSTMKINYPVTVLPVAFIPAILKVLVQITKAVA